MSAQIPFDNGQWPDHSSLLYCNRAYSVSIGGKTPRPLTASFLRNAFDMAIDGTIVDIHLVIVRNIHQLSRDFTKPDVGPSLHSKKFVTVSRASLASTDSMAQRVIREVPRSITCGFFSVATSFVQQILATATTHGIRLD